MLPKVSPSFQVHLFIPPRLHDIPVMYFCSLCPLRNDSIVNVELEMELGFASSTGRNHCSESTARLCVFNSRYNVSVVIFSVSSDLQRFFSDFYLTPYRVQN